MKIKYLKPMLLLLATGLFVNNLIAQRAYVNINAGYELNMSSQNLSYFDFINFTVDSTSITAEQVNVSLGKGLNVECAFGYMFNKNIGAELDISYLFGAKSKARDYYLHGIIKHALSSTMLRINPSLVITAGFEKVNPYAKIGCLVGSGAIRYENNSREYDGNTQTTKMLLDGGLAFGLNAGAGVLYKMNERLSFFGELNSVNLSYAPTKGKLTESTNNGIDRLPDLTTREKEIEYVDTITRDVNNPRPDSKPRQELKQSFPFGSVGLNIGLRIGF